MGKDSPATDPISVQLSPSHNANVYAVKHLSVASCRLLRRLPVLGNARALPATRPWPMLRATRPAWRGRE